MNFKRKKKKSMRRGAPKKGFWSRMTHRRWLREADDKSERSRSTYVSAKE